MLLIFNMIVPLPFPHSLASHTKYYPTILHTEIPDYTLGYTGIRDQRYTMQCNVFLEISLIFILWVSK